METYTTRSNNFSFLLFRKIPRDRPQLTTLSLVFITLLNSQQERERAVSHLFANCVVVVVASCQLRGDIRLHTMVSAAVNVNNNDYVSELLLMPMVRCRNQY